jgi:hypothetical protein
VKKIDLTKTRAALKVYDEHYATRPEVSWAKNDEFKKWETKSVDLADAVMTAFDEEKEGTVLEGFWEPTHPGEPVPSPGFKEAWVRKCVRQWETKRRRITGSEERVIPTIFYRRRFHCEEPWLESKNARLEFHPYQGLLVHIEDRDEPLSYVIFDWEEPDPQA